ncbi:MAG: hypothetical protein CM15mP47_2720 [Methanobacteriota archaeon]|nr:MAG: hypothetical protein CM15mP47_2720 [Euryarchaeota archaeon]
MFIPSEVDAIVEFVDNGGRNHPEDYGFAGTIAEPFGGDIVETIV